jgi:Domain of unknown function (DUF4832)/Domain of unknown function (DUF4874)
MKYLSKLLLSGGCFLLIATGSQCQLIGAKNPSTTVTTYQPSDRDFANPERGFASVYDPPWPQDLKISWSFCNPSPENSRKYTYTALTAPLNLTKLKSDRDRGMSLAMVRYHIAAFRDKPLSPEFLTRLDNDFATVRKAGMKSVLRFTYNWPMGGPDASTDRILQHLDRLKPVLQRNVDAIAFMDAGFIGCWGEWHTSSNNSIGMDTKTGQAVMNQNSQRIADKIFEILPKERMVAFRYPRYKFDYFGSKSGKPIAPLKPSEAFSGSKKARWGQHDDCLVCGEWNASTFWSLRENAGEIESFLNQDNRYVVQSGEPGDIPKQPVEADLDKDGYTGNYDSCPRVLNLFAKMHWSTINGNFNPGSATSSYKRWKQDGCYETIAQRLGYRFRLIDSSIPTSIKSGDKLAMSFKIANDGWAAPYNPRKLEIILRNRKNGAISRINLRDDPRLWQAGATQTVNVRSPLPKLTTGTYDLLLNLPDPTAKLKNRPEYSIRLANNDLWEAKSGYNSLRRSIVVSP